MRIYETLCAKLKGRVVVKISQGEPCGHNLLQPALMAALVKKLDGTIVECNTAYEGRRFDSKEHWKAIKEHCYLDIAPCDIMDEFGEIALRVSGGVHLTENFVGEHIKNYGSMLILSHFKGHMMGGFDGALKNMSIGVASSHGKGNIHASGDPTANIIRRRPQLLS